MNKKWLVWLISFIAAAVLLTGCGADQKEVRETTESFMQALVDSDLETAKQYATKELIASEEMRLLDKENLETSFYDAIGVKRESLGEEAQKAVSEYVSDVVDKAYQSYEIGDIKIQGDTASVTTKVTLGFDPDAESNLAETAQEEINSYQTENYEDLVNVYIEEGETALYNKLYNDLLPIIAAKMKDELDNSSSKEESTILTLKKTDEGWKVTQLQEAVTDAEESDAAQETASTSQAADAAQETASTSQAAEEEETE